MADREPPGGDSMDAKGPPEVSNAELRVLQSLWDCGPSTIRQLTERLYPSVTTAIYATVQKLLERLPLGPPVAPRPAGDNTRGARPRPPVVLSAAPVRRQVGATADPRPRLDHGRHRAGTGAEQPGRRRGPRGPGPGRRSVGEATG